MGLTPPSTLFLAILAVTSSMNPHPTWAAFACTGEHGPRSGTETGNAKIRFENRSSTAVDIWWIDREGQRHFQGALSSGQSREYDTHVLHAWVATNRDNACVGAWVVEADRVTALVPSSFFECENGRMVRVAWATPGPGTIVLEILGMTRPVVMSNTNEGGSATTFVGDGWTATLHWLDLYLQNEALNVPPMTCHLNEMN